MSDYPDNWFRDGGAGNSPGAAGASGEPTVPHGGGYAAEPTVQVPGPAYTPAAAGGPAGQPGGGPSPGSAWPEQPPIYGGQRDALGGRAAGGRWSGGGWSSGGWAGWRQRWLRPRRTICGGSVNRPALAFLLFWGPPPGVNQQVLLPFDAVLP